MIPPQPSSTLFPYTTLFRSGQAGGAAPPRDCFQGGRVARLQGGLRRHGARGESLRGWEGRETQDRKSTRLNSSHRTISYAVFCLKKKKKRKKSRKRHTRHNT